MYSVTFGLTQNALAGWYAVQFAVTSLIGPSESVWNGNCGGGVHRERALAGVAASFMDEVVSLITRPWLIISSGA